MAAGDAFASCQKFFQGYKRTTYYTLMFYSIKCQKAASLVTVFEFECICIYPILCVCV